MTQEEVFERTGNAYLCLIHTMTQTFGDELDRSAFDGELGWAVDKAKHLLGFSSPELAGRGPNYGQSFEDHLEVYNWMLSSEP